MIPAAMENKNDVFITDQGSNRDSRSRALRVRRAVPTLFFAPVAVSPDLAAAGPGPPGTIGIGSVDGPLVSVPAEAFSGAPASVPGARASGVRNIGVPAGPGLAGSL